MLATTNLVPVRVWTAQAVGLSSSATSAAIRVGLASRCESLLMQVTSVLSAVPSVKLEYAVSDDGTNFGSFADYTDLVAASVTDFPTPEGVYAVSLPNFLSNWIKFKVTELGVVADTLVTLTLWLREGV